MEEEIKTGNKELIDRMYGDRTIIDDIGLELTMYKYEISMEDVFEKGISDYEGAIRDYASAIEARHTLIITEDPETRTEYAKALINDVKHIMSALGFTETDYEHLIGDNGAEIRTDMNEETRALIAINDLITVYRYILFNYTHIRRDKLDSIISDDIENSNLEYVSQMDINIDDHDVSGLID